MAMVTSNKITGLNNVKPFKTTWKVEVKVLDSWTQNSNYSGGDSFEFILADKKIVCVFDMFVLTTNLWYLKFSFFSLFLRDIHI